MTVEVQEITIKISGPSNKWLHLAQIEGRRACIERGLVYGETRIYCLLPEPGRIFIKDPGKEGFGSYN